MPSELGAQLVDVGAGLHEQRAHRAALAVEQRQHDVRRLEELVVAADGQGLGIGQGLLESAGEFVHAHGITPQVDRWLCGDKRQSIQGSATLSPAAGTQPRPCPTASLTPADQCVNHSAQAMTPMPAPIRTTWMALVRGSARRCSPGMSPATAM